MSRHRIEAPGELWWVGYDTQAGTYFADRDEDLDRDEYTAPYLPRFVDLDRAIAGKLVLPGALRSELAGEEPARIDTVEASVMARHDQLAATLRDSPPLDPELQRIVDLNKLNYPTSATEIRPPATGSVTEGRGYRPPPELGRGSGHGFER